MHNFLGYTILSLFFYILKFLLGRIHAIPIAIGRFLSIDSFCMMMYCTVRLYQSLRVLSFHILVWKILILILPRMQLIYQSVTG